MRANKMQEGARDREVLTPPCKNKKNVKDVEDRCQKASAKRPNEVPANNWVGGGFKRRESPTTEKTATLGQTRPRNRGNRHLLDPMRGERLTYGSWYSELFRPKKAQERRTNVIPRRLRTRRCGGQRCVLFWRTQNARSCQNDIQMDKVQLQWIVTRTARFVQLRKHRAGAQVSTEVRNQDFAGGC